MGVFNRLKDSLEQGVRGSQRLFKEARENTQQLEESAILRIDVKRIDNKMNQLIRDLGISVYSILHEEGKQSVSKKSPGVKEIFQELEDLQAMRDAKEALLSPENEVAKREEGGDF